MLQINLSDAFSVLLTFSSSPKRHVVCQRAFIKLDQRENNVNTLGSRHRHTNRISQRRCLLLSSAGAAAPRFLPEEQPLPPLCLYRPTLRGKHMYSEQQCTSVENCSKGTNSILQLSRSCAGCCKADGYQQGTDKCFLELQITWCSVECDC